MKNVTISMDEDTLRWVRIEAARAGMSVSRWIGAQMRTLNVEQAEKAAASARIEAFLDDFPGLPLSENGKITIDRDEMYEHLLRRYDDPALSSGQGLSGEGAALQGVAESSTDEGSFDP
jgi:type II secretory pathway pseudopilin PulG